MKRLGTLVLAAGLTMASLLALGQGASATPFSDVPANHWAYQAIQSLAADGLVEGYPDGKFKGDRPLTRYEMAVLVARVIAKLQANGAGYASKADLDKLQKLIDALKDELDALGVRVTNLEDALDALDKRTKFAQSIQMHGTILDNNSSRQRYGIPQTIAHGSVDPFVNVFISSPANNSPLEQAGAGNLIRYDDKFNFVYTINENLTVSIPIHIINYEYGGEFTPRGEVLGPARRRGEHRARRRADEPLLPRRPARQHAVLAARSDLPRAGRDAAGSRLREPRAAVREGLRAGRCHRRSGDVPVLVDAHRPDDDQHADQRRRSQRRVREQQLFLSGDPSADQLRSAGRAGLDGRRAAHRHLLRERRTDHVGLPDARSGRGDGLRLGDRRRRLRPERVDHGRRRVPDRRERLVLHPADEPGGLHHAAPRRFDGADRLRRSDLHQQRPVPAVSRQPARQREDPDAARRRSRHLGRADLRLRRSGRTRRGRTSTSPRRTATRPATAWAS